MYVYVYTGIYMCVEHIDMYIYVYISYINTSIITKHIKYIIYYV